MTKWLLILYVMNYAGHFGAITTIELSSREDCFRAAKVHVAVDPDVMKARCVAIKR